MLQTTKKTDLNALLNDLAEELDLAESVYKEAKNRYDAVGKWLNESEALAPYDPKIFPQGSVALGTPIKPQEGAEVDVDAVCLLKIKKAMTTQQRLKNAVGLRLKEHGVYKEMLDPKDGGRRCWTLRYADEAKFHLDILPAIPDEDFERLVARGVPRDFAKTALCITDKTQWTSAEWPKTNPEGYVAWFRDRMKVVFEQRRYVIARETKAQVQDVPEYKVRTPLQRAVQLLKQHRALKFKGDDDLPISIIITTLAAQAYNNEAGLFEALQNMLPKMRAGIENRNGVFWVPNPVNPDENFADKWAETPRKSELFFSWLESLEQLHRNLETSGPEEAAGLLREAYGEASGRRAFEKYSARTRPEDKALQVTRVTLPSRFNVSHRLKPTWAINLKHQVKIAARFSSNGYRWINFSSDALPLKKKLRLQFEAKTNTPGDYEVHWQVVNTGGEATTLGQLRGRIFADARVREERTEYRGMHWVECFIVKNGECVARSGEFVVNIQ